MHIRRCLSKRCSGHKTTSSHIISVWNRNKGCEENPPADHTHCKFLHNLIVIQFLCVNKQSLKMLQDYFSFVLFKGFSILLSLGWVYITGQRPAESMFVLTIRTVTLHIHTDIKQANHRCTVYFLCSFKSLGCVAYHGRILHLNI